MASPAASCGVLQRKPSLSTPGRATGPLRDGETQGGRLTLDGCHAWAARCPGHKEQGGRSLSSSVALGHGPEGLRIPRKADQNAERALLTMRDPFAKSAQFGEVELLGAEHDDDARIRYTADQIDATRSHKNVNLAGTESRDDCSLR